VLGGPSGLIGRQCHRRSAFARGFCGRFGGSARRFSIVARRQSARCLDLRDAAAGVGFGRAWRRLIRRSWRLMVVRQLHRAAAGMAPAADGSLPCHRDFRRRSCLAGEIRRIAARPIRLVHISIPGRRRTGRTAPRSARPKTRRAETADRRIRRGLRDLLRPGFCHRAVGLSGGSAMVRAAGGASVCSFPPTPKPLSRFQPVMVEDISPPPFAWLCRPAISGSKNAWTPLVWGSDAGRSRLPLGDVIETVFRPAASLGKPAIITHHLCRPSMLESRRRAPGAIFSQARLAGCRRFRSTAIRPNLRRGRARVDPLAMDGGNRHRADRRERSRGIALGGPSRDKWFRPALPGQGRW